MAKRNAEADLQLPPGFRFFPTEEELVVDYLCKKASSQPLPVPIIADVDLYKYDPWQLPPLALFGEKEFYFFTPRDRKYPNGSRPNRAAGSGYWKATGADKPITSSTATKGVKKRVGLKKALVFYVGKPPNGTKTNWLMHEYRLAEVTRPVRKKGNLRLDDWVLCRIYRRKVSAEKLALEPNQNFNGVPLENIDEQEMKNQPTSTSIEHSGVEQSNLSFGHLSKPGPSQPGYNVVPPRVSPVRNPTVYFQNPEFFQNSTPPFTFSNVKAAVQSTIMNRISSSTNRQWKNCTPTDFISGFHNDSSSAKLSRFSEEVQSSFRLEYLPQEQQQPFNIGFQGLQNTISNFDQVSFSESSAQYLYLG